MRALFEVAHVPCDSALVPMDWDDLRYFLALALALALAPSGALAGAARELGCEHTTVGRRLTALEGALGARLFTRGPRGLRDDPAVGGGLPRA